MPQRRPQVAVFFGGDPHNHDVSTATGYWMCEHIPREHFDVVPVRINTDGTWQMPVGTLPRRGAIASVVSKLMKGAKKLSAADGLAQLLSRPTKALMSVIRGAAGDGGGLHSVGHLTNTPVIGSPAHVCHVTSHKHVAEHHLGTFAATPTSVVIKRNTDVEEALDEIRDTFLPPLFVKQVTMEGSTGIAEATTTDELRAALGQLTKCSDVLVQPRVGGEELSVTVFKDGHGRVQTLPVTAIRPRVSTFYDPLAKRYPGRAHLDPRPRERTGPIAEAEAIARDVYRELGCHGIVSVDMVADVDGITLLEINTVPVATAATPLIHQLKAAGIHPTTLLHHVLYGTLERPGERSPG